MDKIIYQVVKDKADVIGFWKDSEGKLYKDNIKLVRPETVGQWHSIINELFKSGEQAVFYILGNTAYIEDKEGNIEELRHKIGLEKDFLTNKETEELLNQYDGFTVFEKGNKILIETWTK